MPFGGGVHAFEGSSRGAASQSSSPSSSFASSPSTFPRPLRGRITTQEHHPKNREALPALSPGERPEGSEEPIVTRVSLNHHLTQHYIRHYTSSGGRAYLSGVMERGGMYLSFIRGQIDDMGLPAALLYIPVIESSFVPTALSRSGASGLWQFMTNSIAPFDMKVNDWVDERRDFWKSTQGALRKLEENYRNFNGDWFLALASYNAGLGAINRLVRQSGGQDYWTLSQRGLLPNETTHYVPKLVAVSHLLSNQRRYGIKAHWPGDPEWRRLSVERAVDLRVVAEYAHIDSDDLLRANRELLYNITPPGQHYIKVSSSFVDQVAAVLTRSDLPLIRHYIHTIRSGDTLGALALHYGVSVDFIKRSNPGIEERSLRIGSRLHIPALRDVGPYVRTAAPREKLEFNGTHLVKSGETLWAIALAYEVDPETLAEANNMKMNDILREGRVLRTPTR